MTALASTTTRPEVVIFYAGLILEEHASLSSAYDARKNISQEIYNGAYVWLRPTPNWKYLTEWSRMDGTPVLLQDVPNALKAWVLIL